MAKISPEVAYDRCLRVIRASALFKFIHIAARYRIKREADHAGAKPESKAGKTDTIMLHQDEIRDEK